MFRPFYPGAPRDVDEAARKTHRLLEQQAARATLAGLSPDAASHADPAASQLAQADSGNSAASDDPLAGWPATQSPLSSTHIREPDAYAREGGGFRANRTHGGTNLPHKGVDLATEPATPVYSPIEGTVTHIGWAYEGGAHGLRSIHITSPDGHKVKMFYVDPTDDLAVGQAVTPNTQLGMSQSLQDAYPVRKSGPMTDHVHIEFWDPQGRLVDPMPWVDRWHDQTSNWERLGQRQSW